MTLIDHFKGIWGISLCAWGMIGLYTSFRIRRFIVKRYKQETELLKTVYFKKHATFTKYLPTLISSPVYIAHLISFFWGWRYFKKRKVFTDIKDPKDVTHHFSKKEIRLVKTFVITGIIIILHCATYSLFGFIRPDLFG